MSYTMLTKRVFDTSDATVEERTVKVKCFAKEHNAISPVRARTQNAQSGLRRANYYNSICRQENVFRSKVWSKCLTVNSQSLPW